jgi:hypothetical protein
VINTTNKVVNQQLLFARLRQRGGFVERWGFDLPVAFGYEESF